MARFVEKEYVPPPTLFKCRICQQARPVPVAGYRWRTMIVDGLPVRLRVPICKECANGKAD